MDQCFLSFSKEKAGTQGSNVTLHFEKPVPGDDRESGFISSVLKAFLIHSEYNYIVYYLFWKDPGVVYI